MGRHWTRSLCAAGGLCAALIVGQSRAVANHDDVIFALREIQPNTEWSDEVVRMLDRSALELPTEPMPVNEARALVEQASTTLDRFADRVSAISRSLPRLAEVPGQLEGALMVQHRQYPFDSLFSDSERAVGGVTEQVRAERLAWLGEHAATHAERAWLDAASETLWGMRNELARYLGQTLPTHEGYQAQLNAHRDALAATRKQNGERSFFSRAFTSPKPEPPLPTAPVVRAFEWDQVPVGATRHRLQSQLNLARAFTFMKGVRLAEMEHSRQSGYGEFDAAYKDAEAAFYLHEARREHHQNLGRALSRAGQQRQFSVTLEHCRRNP